MANHEPSTDSTHTEQIQAPLLDVPRPTSIANQSNMLGVVQALCAVSPKNKAPINNRYSLFAYIDSVNKETGEIEESFVIL